ncbi:MAG: tRNA (N(6)-L-threonylcarbamoyladenosine(37)-C(2))-methylthiotransferase MtaB [Rhizobacter sp.]|nr:tRNA (N(6)-L-threonylcarbamoyladenosine(37)-C(2))-methylthiotransferase MtaB [Chlorobiales bacterium]
MKKISTYTLGCKLNFAESSAMAQAFLKQGFELVPFGEASDVTLINTCSVTENANQKCRNVVRQALRKSPESFVAVVGCYAQLEPEELASIEGVDAVLGAKEKFEMFDLLDFKKTGDTRIHVSEISTVETFGIGHSMLGDSASRTQTRAYLKVQDGCDYTCSYCTIPLARGTSRSQSVEKTILEARLLIDAGYKEIVLTGVNIGDYGAKDGSTFSELLRALDQLPIPRLRISSIEPNLLTGEMIDFIAASKRIVPHFHLPMQSGSDAVLRAMRRRYTTDLYRERCEEVISKLPDCCIGGDVIVGFPDETDEHFEETVKFIEDLPLAYLHVFTFSERRDTYAAEQLASKAWMPTNGKTKSHRSNVLHLLSEKKKRAFYERFTGRELEVLFENEFSDDREMNAETSEKLYCYGHTANYLRVGVAIASKETAQADLARTFRRVRLTGVDSSLNMTGELV